MNSETPLPPSPDVGTVIEHRLLSRLVRSFAIATGLGVNVLTPQGELVPMAGTGLHPFCRAVQATKEGKARCIASLGKGGELAARLGEPYIFRCHAGLIEWSAPVVVGNRFLGSFSCGPVLLWPLDDLAMEEISSAVGDLGFSPEDLKKLLAEVKVLRGPDVQAAAELLFVVANHLAQTGLLTLMQRRELNEQQARLAELIGARKRKEEILHELEAQGSKSLYPLEMERTLLGRVRIGDRTGAKEILNELLGEIFLKSGGDLEVIKARLLELLIVISRAAVEGGASLERLFGVNYEYIRRLAGIDRFEDLCRWIVEALDTFMDTVYDVRRIKNAKLLAEATKYIRENYHQPLTLEKVAQQVYVSPFYLSHLFKSELGLTFVEYLTRVRIEEAKRLLATSNLSVLGVAEKVGYEDASYFSKVFRKVTGMTPNQYRRSC
ncbi:MAG: PocR ligand-binding domain-containing protein [Bacillota bacterium]